MESLLANHQLSGKYFCVGCLHCSTSPDGLECGITKAYRWGQYSNFELMKKRNAYTGTKNAERNATSRNIDGPGELEIHDYKRSGDSLHLLGECVFVCIFVNPAIHPASAPLTQFNATTTSQSATSSMSRRYAFLTLFVSCVSQTLPNDSKKFKQLCNNLKSIQRQW